MTDRVTNNLIASPRTLDDQITEIQRRLNEDKHEIAVLTLKRLSLAALAIDADTWYLRFEWSDQGEYLYLDALCEAAGFPIVEGGDAAWDDFSDDYGHLASWLDESNRDTWQAYAFRLDGEPTDSMSRRGAGHTDINIQRVLDDAPATIKAVYS